MGKQNYPFDNEINNIDTHERYHIGTYDEDIKTILVALKKDIEFLKQDINTIKKGISKLNELEKSFITYETNIKNIMKRFEDLKAEFGEHLDEVNDIRLKIQNIEQRLTNVEKSKDALNSMVKQILIAVGSIIAVAIFYMVADYLSKHGIK